MESSKYHYLRFFTIRFVRHDVNIRSSKNIVCAMGYWEEQLKLTHRTTNMPVPLHSRNT